MFKKQKTKTKKLGYVWKKGVQKFEAQWKVWCTKIEFSSPYHSQRVQNEDLSAANCLKFLTGYICHFSFLSENILQLDCHPEYFGIYYCWWSQHKPVVCPYFRSIIKFTLLDFLEYALLPPTTGFAPKIQPADLRLIWFNMFKVHISDPYRSMNKKHGL